MNSRHHRAPERARILLVALLLLPVIGRAAGTGGAPIQVSADNGRFEQASGSGTYSGNVELIQGQRKLYADVMKLFTRDGALVRVEASGSPVRMEEGKDLNAHANKLVYDVKAHTLVLTGNAFIKHQGNTFEGARVQYSLDSKRVDASGKGDQRVRLVIPAENQPGNQKTTPAPSPDSSDPQPAEPSTP
ncbi:MAG: lipopolysaccharide transport periplasmic protein LptA [Alcanivorax sp.]|nr:lipopolysaccharide transport periplasmic protein LptA [Alcanivorax sp.]